MINPRTAKEGSSSPSRVTILGCGASAGVPLVNSSHPGGFWGKCDPKHPRNVRTRASIYVQYQGLKLLVDTSPDLRQQLLREKLHQLDGVLWTHYHADHVHGIDDLRPLFFSHERKPIPVYGDAPTLEAIQSSFAYLFNQGSLSIYPKVLWPHLIGEEFEIQGVSLKSFQQQHGPGVSRGYRFGPLAYSTDFNHLDPKALKCLEGVEVWIVDCMDLQPRPTHCHLDLTLRWIEKVGPKHAILTHLNSNMDYESLRCRLPRHIEPAYDGLTVDF